MTSMMMALCWAAVTLSLLMSAGNHSVAGDQNKLPELVSNILNMYKPSYRSIEGGRKSPMFSLAVSVPYDSVKKTFDTSKVAATDPGNQVRDTILKCDVYTGVRVVAATVLKWPNVLDQCPRGAVRWPDVLRKCKQTAMTWAEVQNKCPPGAVWWGRADHAEYRTLQHFNTLTRNLNKNDFMLFYVLSSPCYKRCTSESSHWSILDSMKQIKKWENYAVVFSNVFKSQSGDPIPEKERRGALERLGQSVGLNNIYRCTGNNVMRCRRCSSGNQVTPFCYSD